MTLRRRVLLHILLIETCRIDLDPSPISTKRCRKTSKRVTSSLEDEWSHRGQEEKHREQKEMNGRR